MSIQFSDFLSSQVISWICYALAGTNLAYEERALLSDYGMLRQRKVMIGKQAILFDPTAPNSRVHTFWHLSFQSKLRIFLFCKALLPTSITFTTKYAFPTLCLPSCLECAFLSAPCLCPAVASLNSSNHISTRKPWWFLNSALVLELIVLLPHVVFNLLIYLLLISYMRPRYASYTSLWMTDRSWGSQLLHLLGKRKGNKSLSTSISFL